MRKNILNSNGYTIIETMVSISVFLVVIIFGMTALLNANALHKKSQDMRSIIDNLSFIMDEMSRNLRVGYNFRCVTDGNFSNITVPQSCSTGGAVAFEYSATGSRNNPNDQWVYKIASTDGGVTFNISKSIDSGTTWIQLNPRSTSGEAGDVAIDSFSGFSVLGALPAGTAAGQDQQQPLINIRLSGKITYKNVVTPFSLQSSVSQRAVDT